MYRRFVDADWAIHAFDRLPKELVPKENRAHYNLLNSLPTKNILFSKVVVHVPQILLPVHVQIDLVLFQNNKRQT